MGLRTLLKSTGVLAVGAAAVGLAGRLRHERATATLVADLLADADRSRRAVAPEEFAGLPDPVRRYLDLALADDRSHVRTARLRQRGEFRLGGAESAWKPFAATHHVAVRPPGFVWDAAIEAAPLVPVRVVDSYVGGTGGLRATLFGLVAVADPAPTPELDEGELVRYLAEAVWLPSALAPGAGVAWDPIDDRSARATVDHRGTTASAVFHFEDDRIVRVTADRPRRLPDGRFESTPWTGSFGRYRERNGVTVPTEASVAWRLPAGDLPYWRARVTGIDHRPPIR
ncbi:DUF6544 family protein [Halorussus marinus]|uniref:DUF6544 family protein n=1 Tax=Halorussus marinus TaxID=2505976 RepID=UPI001091E50B|nr:DUF6544 family protein [Halorussus marinus]